MAKTHKPLYRSLYFQVICAIVVGVLVKRPALVGSAIGVLRAKGPGWEPAATVGCARNHVGLAAELRAVHPLEHTGRGRRGVHQVAPKSMSAWLKS